MTDTCETNLSIFSEAAATEPKGGEDNGIWLSRDHETGGGARGHTRQKEREWSGTPRYKPQFDSGNNMYRNESLCDYSGVVNGRPISTTSDKELLPFQRQQQQHIEKEDEYSTTHHHRRVPHSDDPTGYSGMRTISRGSLNTMRGDGNHSRIWSQSGVMHESNSKCGVELGLVPPPPPYLSPTLPEPPPSVAIIATDHSGSVLSSPPPSIYGSSQVKVSSGRERSSATAAVIPNEYMITQERKDIIMKMDGKVPLPPCNQDQMMVPSSATHTLASSLNSRVVSLPPLAPPACPEMEFDPFDIRRRELRNELDKYLICEMQYQEVAFYFKVIGHRIEKLLMSR